MNFNMIKTLFLNGRKNGEADIIAHVLNNLEKTYQQNIRLLTGTNPIQGCGYKCHLYKLDFNPVGSAIFLVFVGKKRGVILPPNNPCWDLKSYNLPSSQTTDDLIKNVKTIAALLKHKIRGAILANQLGIV